MTALKERSVVEEVNDVIFDLCKEIKEKKYLQEDKILLIKALALLVEARAKL